MSSRAESATRRVLESSDGATVELRIDRVACTGHGVCAAVLPRNIELDEWGYPVVRDPMVTAEDAAMAIKLCPAMAIYRATP